MLLRDSCTSYQEGDLMTAEARMFAPLPPLLDAARALEPQIQAASEIIDKECVLPASLFEALRNTGLFRVSWWKSCGGLELDPLAQMPILEELSRVNGSVGW